MAATHAEQWQKLALGAISGDRQRVGGARRAVVEALAREDCCISVQELADAIRAGGGGAGVASVYRALELLERGGLVQRVEVREGGARYEAVVPGGEHHHHAICERCGELTPFEDQQLERAIGDLSRRLGHTVRAHDVVIRGVCETCSRRASG